MAHNKAQAEQRVREQQATSEQITAILQAVKIEQVSELEVDTPGPGALVNFHCNAAAKLAALRPHVPLYVHTFTEHFTTDACCL